MIYLFSKDGLRFLESVCFTQCLYAFDFDGTLSRIVKNPHAAKISPSTLKRIQQLGRQAPVAIISGRGLADLRVKFDPSPGFLVGNHGLEGIHYGEQKLESFRESCEKWKDHLEKAFLKGGAAAEGLEIEDKIFSIAIHYRKSRAKKIAKTLILEALAELVPAARLIMGKCVVNIVPSGAPHKGIALLELMLEAGTKSALYIGDDDTDEDVFTISDPRLFTIRVGQKKNSQAKFYIRRQEEINALLEAILSFKQRNTAESPEDSRADRRT